MSFLRKKCLNVISAFALILLYPPQLVKSDINYSDIRGDDQPSEVQPDNAKTTREILEMFNNWVINRENNSLQEATEHLLQFGALLRTEITDHFGTLVYDHYDDYSIGQTEALYKVYRETLERKYNIFDIVPSFLAIPDMRPTQICRYINKHVNTCLKESSMLCTTIRKHDDPQPGTSITRAIIDMTRRMYKGARIRARFRNGFTLPAILSHLKAGNLNMTVGLVSGLLHNVQYDSFDDEVRTAERKVAIVLTPEMLSADRKKVLVEKDLFQDVHTVSELLREVLESRKTMYDKEKNKNFAILSEHLVREVDAIGTNIELLGTVYENNTIDMLYLLNLILPPDVVDEDVTEAKDYLLRKTNDYDVVRKYLKVEKYQQSGPDQLLMEILGQMRDINFAVDLATALHVHARFWHQSHMIKNLNELLELFDAYENLRNVPKYSNFMSLIDKIRNTLWDSKNVTVELSCNRPRACLHIGLEIIANCTLVDYETKNNIRELFLSLHKSGATYTADECPVLAMNQTEVPEKPKTTLKPITINAEFIPDLITVETTSSKSAETSMPTTDDDETTKVLTTKKGTENSSTVKPTMTETPTKLLTIGTEDATTLRTSTLTTKVVTTEISKQQTTDVADEKWASTPLTTEETVVERASTESMTETATAEEKLSTEQMTEKLMTEVRAKPKPGLRTQQRTNTQSANPLNTNRNPPPPPLSDNMKTIKLENLSTTTTIPTMTKDSRTTAEEVIAASSPSSGNTTAAISEDPGSSEKPGSDNGSSSSGEDCSGENCISNDCSGGRCPPYSDDCSSTDSNNTNSSDCMEDRNHSSCQGPDCKPSIHEGNIRKDCPDGGCQTTSGIFEETRVCADGEECSTKLTECIGDSCTEAPLKNNKVRDCSGDECSDHDDEITRKKDPPLTTSGTPLIRCDNKDPHHRKKLDKLKRIRMINALHATALNPTRTVDSIDDDSSNEFHSFEPIKKHHKLSHPGLPPWLKFPWDEDSNRPSSWEPDTNHKNEHGDRNTNFNMNFINLRRNPKVNFGSVDTPLDPILHKVNPPNGGYQRVLSRNSEGLDSGKSNANPKLDKPLDKNSDISRKRPVGSMSMDRVIYQKQRSDGKVELVRKNRSIIRAPQRASRRYRAL